NKRGYKLAKELKKPVVFLPDYEDVNQEFAQDPFILKIAKKLREKQDTVFVYPFTTAFLDLPTPDFTVLGSNNELAKQLDNKINQLKLFKRLGLPHNKARIFDSKEDLLEHEYEAVPSYISAAYTSGGNESGLIYSPEMLHEFLAKLRLINKKNSFIVSDIFENIVLAPNVNSLVTGDGKVYTLVLSDQILQGNRYLGNTYPSVANENNRQEIYDITEKIGKYLAGQGYVGLFGLDFLINKAGELVVVDLNPRHQGGYSCNGLALTAKGLSLTDIELSVLLGEEVKLSQSELDEQLDFAWSHSKIMPNEKGQAIHSEYSRDSITTPFSSVGQSYVTEFYQEGSVFIEGYIGYQVHTANELSELDAITLRTREEFDAQVLGL
ncbi:MAG TPA: ATP-grasp domain-containing protein, partial [Candidatus Saccharimonadales bacterium]|nr:ATP-grasp domain-containing protein [Candidatus Saccharimonadales bacterium]